MNFMKMLHLMLCAFVVGLVAQSYVVPAAPIEVARDGIAGALQDKQNDGSGSDEEESGDESDSRDGSASDDQQANQAVVNGEQHEEEENDEDGEQPNRWVCPSRAAVRAVGAALLDRGMNFGRGCVDYVRNIDYRGHANAVRDNWHRIYDNGFVNSCWSGVRKVYWYTPVIPADQRDFNKIYVFGRDGADVALQTTNDFHFMVPADVIGNGFLNQDIKDHFYPIITSLKQRFGINVSADVFYLLCSIKRMQRAPEADGLEADALFEANIDVLGNIVLRLYDEELFDAIKACGHLQITDEVMRGVLMAAVANALCKNNPLGKAIELVKLNLEAFPVSQGLLLDAIQVVAEKALAAMKNGVVAAPVAAGNGAVQDNGMVPQGRGRGKRAAVPNGQPKPAKQSKRRRA